MMNVTSPQGSTFETRARKATVRRRRITGFLIAATTSLLSLGLSGPAFAMMVPPGGSTRGPSIPVAAPAVKVISTGVSTWQVALIAIGAALLGAAAVLLVSRLRPARRAAAASAV
ncbi:MAG TPA: hypothetical protein VGM79_30155 [Streptosporangiaceae bacterium]|jgi:hypothetical protein